MSDTVETPVEFITYDLSFLLDRAYGAIKLDKKKIVIPQLIFEKKDRKTYIHNFTAVCAALNRDTEDLRQFISKELAKDASIKENGALKIDSMVQNVGMIESIIKLYTIDYVMCKACKSCKTTIKKEDRITFMVCDNCKASRAI